MIELLLTTNGADTCAGMRAPSVSCAAALMKGIRQRAAKRAFSTRAADVEAKRRRHKCAAAEGGIRHSATWLFENKAPHQHHFRPVLRINAHPGNGGATAPQLAVSAVKSLQSKCQRQRKRWFLSPMMKSEEKKKDFKKHTVYSHRIFSM